MSSSSSRKILNSQPTVSPRETSAGRASPSRKSGSGTPGNPAAEKEHIRRRIEQIREKIEKSPEKAALILGDWVRDASREPKTRKKAG
jgi:hypothetical protein